jgi:hypothetical protein
MPTEGAIRPRSRLLWRELRAALTQQSRPYETCGRRSILACWSTLIRHASRGARSRMLATFAMLVPWLLLDHRRYDGRVAGVVKLSLFCPGDTADLPSR